MGSANQVADGRNTTTDVGTLTDRRIAQEAGTYSDIYRSQVNTQDQEVSIGSENVAEQG